MGIIAYSQGQDDKVPVVFETYDALPLQFTYSNKQMRKQASTESYVKSMMSYMHEGVWDSIPVELRARGNFRRTNCYFPPIKLKIKSSDSKGTLFEGLKKMKVVLPCLLQNRSNDDILKEYLAYKLYEPFSTAHFKTRLVDLEFTDDPRQKKAEDPLTAIFMEVKKRNLSTLNDSVFARRKPRTHHLRAILIEDIKNVAKRNDAKVFDRFVHPLAQDAMSSLRNAFFQFMIGNTDFSTAYGHNQKLLFLDKKAVPLPYDFDMSGLVDASYSVVSNINNQDLPISDVTQRLYRGFKRDPKTTQAIRTEFLNQKTTLLNIVDDLKEDFDNRKTYQKTRNYLLDFFAVLENESRFKREILDKARAK
ncbi:hypothetical protein [Maribacter sp. 2307UL18-2]|uniref:hypothetical protein n=1 Tax=Maribacter sp. 2307UL18-2 TaxID=3386274 RepID=UPI0039BD7A5E